MAKKKTGKRNNSQTHIPTHIGVIILGMVILLATVLFLGQYNQQENLFSNAAGTTCANKVAKGQLYGVGNAGMCVKYIQRMLNGVDRAKLSVDGIFGPL